MNVTTMLVITTMFINVSNNLPKTAYIKMIDIWLLFNLTKPFVDIHATTYMASLKSDESREIRLITTEKQGVLGGRKKTRSQAEES